MMAPRAHEHEYIPHPTWSTHHVCRICGFAVPTRLVPNNRFARTEYQPAVSRAKS